MNVTELIQKLEFNKIKNKSLFITGGTGFFGIWLLRLFNLLNDKGYKFCVTILSRNPEKFIGENPQYAAVEWLHWIKGDIMDYRFPPENFDLFIQGAADTKPEAMRKPSLVFQNIVSGTKHVLEHAIACKAKRLLLISSGAVYGEVPVNTDFITEAVNTAPLTNRSENTYGEAKRAAETLATCFATENNIEIVIARCFAFAGTGIGQHLVLSQLINQAQKEKEIFINGSGLARRSFLHGRDLAIWLIKLLIDGSANEIYNVGSDVAYTIKGLAELVRNAVDPKTYIIIGGKQKQEPRMNYIPSIVKSQQLGLGVWTTLEESISEMIDPDLFMPAHLQ